MVSSLDQVDLGVHDPEKAKDMVSQARALGLDAITENLDVNPIEEDEFSFGLMDTPATVDGAGPIIPALWIFIAGAIIIAVILWVVV